jgi:hypothetical protein
MRKRRVLLGASFGLAAAAALGGATCTRHHFVDFILLSGYRPEAPSWQPPPPYQLFAGDLHCHVLGPDVPTEVVRDLEETVHLAKEEHLDFVLLTPHIGARFFEHPRERDAFLAKQRALGDALAAIGDGATLFLRGFEYTDHSFGHVGGAFADLGRVLAEVPVRTARKAPGRFFERWVENGGLLFLNHPLVTPLSSMFSEARRNLSWRPLTSGRPVPPEIAAVHRLAQGFEAYNFAVSYLRDRILQGDTDKSIRATLLSADREILRTRRRITPVAGSDSHSHHLRAVIFVLARERTERSLRDAIAAGRTCLRSPQACSFEVRAPRGEWRGVGSSLRAAMVEARAQGGPFELWHNGQSIARAEEGEVVRLAIPERSCSVLRAEVDEGYSAPIYVNCDFADADGGGVRRAGTPGMNAAAKGSR